MYTLKNKKKAVDLLINYDYAYRKVIRELGYPNSRTTLRKWCEEYKDRGQLSINYKRKPKYSEANKLVAVNYYLNHGKNISRTIKKLGYPCRAMLGKWIDELAGHQRKNTRAGGVVVKYNYTEKKEAVFSLITRKDTAEVIAAKHQVSHTSLYKWSKEMLSIEAHTMAKKPKKTKDELIIESKQEKQKLLDINESLKKENERLRFENDVLEKASEVIKKDVGINLRHLNNNEKATVINALRDKYTLKKLLNRLDIEKSSYFYQITRMQKDDKYCELRKTIKFIFNSAYNAYGYRRITITLKNKGITVSEKVVRRLMKEEGLIIKRKRKKKYNSYLGEISPAVDNLLDRDFYANKPNEKWLTDLTEFAIPAGKVYLSPVIDCFDGLPVSWTISTSPNADLANIMLDQAILTLSEDEKPIVHSDRGCHYRWPGWIERMDEAHLIRSMSKKACSPDNSACEGFFGTIKQEMFYYKSWANVSIDSFIEYLNTYLEWFSTDRIKCSLNGMSPIDYRISLGLLV